MTTTVGVLQFGGSNCDRDVAKAIRNLEADAEPRLVWYKDSLEGCDAVVLPGGFSYGDYLRAGAIASQAPVMDEVREMADAGKPVLGICNGAQILCEAGVVGGAYTDNRSAKFQCEPTHLRVESTDTPFTRRYTEGEVVEVPIAHAEGRYVAGDLDALESSGRALFRYVDEDGEPSEEVNPNGSDGNLAGVRGDRANVAAMMPHPERRCDPLLGGEDGRRVFEGMVEAAAE